MKHILIKITDGNVKIMGLNVIGLVRLADEAIFATPFIMPLLTEVQIDGYSQKGELVSISVPLEDFKNGISPKGWSFIYPNPTNEIAKWSAEDQLKVASFREIPVTGIPQDRTFRNAWEDTTPALTVDINMSKARNIWRDKMRDQRAPLIAALDVEYLKALETGANTSAIVANKQALRDVTKDPIIEAAQTPDDLKKAWPEALNTAQDAINSNVRI